MRRGPARTASAGSLKRWIALGFYATLAACLPVAAATAEPAASHQADLDSDYQAMVEPAMDFLDLINRKFPERECVRDRGQLNDDYARIELSLLQMFLVRDDLRQDLREIAMRLATFHPLAPGERGRPIPLAIPPTTESEKAMNARVVQARIALWRKLDELDSKYPASPEARSSEKMGFLITSKDRGWRPDKPTRVLHESEDCGPA
ncbi:MAG TPA: hypothetical protein VF759_01245 [Allosphingosinicella sp.]|jgi:hypothetical protein